MTPEELDQRFAALESRLARLEALLAARGMEPAAARAAPAPLPSAPAASETPARPGRQGLITNVLGWGGAAALVLAAGYLIRLAVEAGWLTPVRQIGAAAVFGLGLIGGGFLLRSTNRQYAGLLPAGGIAILFLAVYGAHLFYGLILAPAATVAVAIVCLLSLWLCRQFASGLYALFAVAGSYSAPALIAGAPSLGDLAIYFTAWSALFSVFAIWRGDRLVYLLAAYLALLVFDYIREARMPEAWVTALAFQTVQFAVFGVATIAYSIRRRAPLDALGAVMHLPALLIFYGLQYALLDEHLPGLAPWIAVVSAFVVLALYLLARATLRGPLPGGEFLLWAYIAIVLFHAGYLEALPHAWAPWVGLVVLPVAAVVLRGSAGSIRGGPVWLVVAVIFLINYLRVVFDADLGDVPAREVLAALYALQLYAGYFLVRSRPAASALKPLLLCAGHLCAMAAALHLVREPIVESAAWAVIALACLAVSLWQRDRLLGQSSLLVFAAAALKVLLYDLGGASPLARIVSLLVVGIAFYAGGLLYQRLPPAAERAAPQEPSPC